MEEKYLPLGTVCMLQNGTKAVMIIGYAIIPKDTNGVMYDYMGCLYPEGIISTDESMVFNHDQIASIISKGYSDDDQVKFMEKLKKVISQVAADRNLNVVQGGTNQSIQQPQQTTPVAPATPEVTPAPVAPAQVVQPSQPVVQPVTPVQPASPVTPVVPGQQPVVQPVAPVQPTVAQPTPVAQQPAPAVQPVAPVQPTVAQPTPVAQQPAQPVTPVQPAAPVADGVLPEVAPDSLFSVDLPTE